MLQHEQILVTYIEKRLFKFQLYRVIHQTYSPFFPSITQLLSGIGILNFRVLYLEIVYQCYSVLMGNEMLKHHHSKQIKS